MRYTAVYICSPKLETSNSPTQGSHPIFSKSYFCCRLLREVQGFPGGSVVKNPLAIAGDPGSIPGLQRPPGEGHGNPLQYSCLGNTMDRGAWPTTGHGVVRVGYNLVTK